MKTYKQEEQEAHRIARDLSNLDRKSSAAAELQPRHRSQLTQNAAVTMPTDRPLWKVFQRFAQKGYTKKNLLECVQFRNVLYFERNLKYIFEEYSYCICFRFVSFPQVFFSPFYARDVSKRESFFWRARAPS